MIVVADSSTLIGLARIGKLSLLSELYGRVLIPKAVYDEVVGSGRHGSENAKMAEYLVVKEVKDEVAVELLLSSFGRGEAEVLTLAREVGADVVLVDEKKARKSARRAGFEVLGVLGMLITAKKRGLIPYVRPFIEKLCESGFRLSEGVIERTLREAGE